MKNSLHRAFALVALLLSGAISAVAQQLDSTKLAKLDTLLSQYYVALMPEENSVKNAECDRLISSCTDSLVRQWVAIRIFDHYKQSPLMGEESVAIYVYDNWFANGKVKLRTDIESFEASMFADFNRSSLLYETAPVIEMYSPDGTKRTVPCKDTLSVLYFYDVSCAKCKLTSIVLPHVLEGLEFPVKLYALYTGSDPDQWAEFRNNFSCLNPNVEVINLWDVQVESDYQKMYGVVSTPKMFLIDGSGMIAGRRLEIESLKNLLAVYVTYYKSQSTGVLPKDKR